MRGVLSATVTPHVHGESRPTSRAELAKRKIEAQYASLAKERADMAARRAELEGRLATLEISSTEKDRLRRELVQKEMAFHRDRRRPMSEGDFEMITLLGRGSSGEVILVKHRASGEYYAMKKLRKGDMRRKEQVNHAWSERHVLVAADHPFVCKLCFAFQNSEFLFLIMEFLPGGDFMTLLMHRHTLSEDEARFYVAEMVVAIDSVHKLGFIHRDVKPDNLLVDRAGHLKLSDFGLCKSVAEDASLADTVRVQLQGDIERSSRRSSTAGTDAKESAIPRSERAAAWRRSAQKQAYSTVGTPDYISYEVLLKRGYNKECDYWSLGVVLFEVLFGYPPFYADTRLETCEKILNWKETLLFPSDKSISWAAKNLILSLLCEPEYRLGARRGLDDFRDHPFFKGIDWDNLRNFKPPFVPNLEGPTDVRYFADNKPLELEQARVVNSRASYLRDPGEEEFIGFTFKRYNAIEGPAGQRAGLSAVIFENPESRVGKT